MALLLFEAFLLGKRKWVRVNFDLFWKDYKAQRDYTHCVICGKKIRRGHPYEKKSKIGTIFVMRNVSRIKYCKKHRRFPSSIEGNFLAKKEKRDKLARQCGFENYEEYIKQLKNLWG